MQRLGDEDGAELPDSTAVYDEIDSDLKVKKKKKKRKKSPKAWLWPVKIIILTFTLSIAFSLVSEITVTTSHIAVSISIVVLIILVSIIADIIGTAAASVNATPFLAMSAKKIRGAKRAVQLAKNNEKVSSICNDVIGDICGIVSGAAGAAIALKLFTGDNIIGGIIVSAIIAALTVGGKALGKKIALKNNQKIIFFVAKVMSVFSKR